MRALSSAWVLSGLLLLITAFHMLTHTGDVAYHNVYRRLYYLPIILAAFRGGLAWGVGAALAASALYLPHAFLLSHHMDPAPAADKLLEMILFVAVGAITGLLVQRERAALLARRAAEERASRLEGLVTLTSGLAHEIRNPLASIQGSLEILSDDYPAGSDKRPILDVGLRETGRLDRVLTDFLAFARPREPDRVEVDLNALARRLAESATLAQQPRAETPGPRVEVIGADAAVVVFADAAQIEQCVLNLTLNAVQWSPPGAAVLLRVRSGRHPSIAVEDRGPGIPADDRDKVFDPYFTRRKGGSGLGLAIAHRIATAHDGTLVCEPREGGGTRVVLRLAAHGGRS